MITNIRTIKIDVDLSNEELSTHELHGELSMNIASSEAKVLDDENAIKVTCIASVVSSYKKSDDPEDGKSLGHLKAEFRAELELRSDSIQAEPFIKENEEDKPLVLIPLLFPYLRTHIQYLHSFVGLSQLPLPYELSVEGLEAVIE